MAIFIIRGVGQLLTDMLRTHHISQRNPPGQSSWAILQGNPSLSLLHLIPPSSWLHLHRAPNPSHQYRMFSLPALPFTSVLCPAVPQVLPVLPVLPPQPRAPAPRRQPVPVPPRAPAEPVIPQRGAAGRGRGLGLQAAPRADTLEVSPSLHLPNCGPCHLILDCAGVGLTPLPTTLRPWYSISLPATLTSTFHDLPLAG